MGRLINALYSGDDAEPRQRRRFIAPMRKLPAAVRPTNSKPFVIRLQTAAVLE
jgi:hypothetical protein